MRVRASNPTQPSCPLCRDPIAEGEVNVCTTCQAHVHVECARELGMCHPQGEPRVAATGRARRRQRQRQGQREPAPRREPAQVRAGARPELLSPLGWLTLVSGLVPLFAGLRELFGRTDPVTGMPSSPTSPYWILAAVLAPVLIWITVGIVAAYSAWSRRRRSPPGS